MTIHGFVTLAFTTCRISAAGDNALSYLEFRSFLRVLRHEDLG